MTPAERPGYAGLAKDGLAWPYVHFQQHDSKHDSSTTEKDRAHIAMTAECYMHNQAEEKKCMS